jgi:hypothetical protein
VPLKPFLEDGSIQLVPDIYYGEVCGDLKDPHNELYKMSKAESKIDGYRNILGKVPYDDD